MRKNLKYLIPVLAGLLLLPVPLLRDFHFESAMLVAVIGAFWAAISGAESRQKNDFRNALQILGLGFLFGTPLFLYSAISGCLTIDGLGFWIFIPVPSIFLGQALGRLARMMKLPYPRTLVVTILLFIALGAWAVEFFTLPQVYFYNHIWGMWPGPIFDESVTLNASLLFFRWITLLWIILLWILPDWDSDRTHKLITVFAVLALLFSYMNLDEMGIITPRDRLKATLNQQLETEHFRLYFDPEAYSEHEVKYWALRHEFHFEQITNILRIEWPQDRKIESYLYAHAWQKKRLVGAKFTSYVPIWLEQDQLHIAKQQLAFVLKHELVHAISKQFGNRLFNGSWSIGMIEGLAEAIAGDASPESTLEQIIAADPPYPTPEEMRLAFSTTGFYGNAASISYTTAGAFVEFLIENYPVSSLKNAYSSLDFKDKDSFGLPFDSLAAAWQRTLPPVVIDSVDQQVSEFIFSRRSLFQRSCPHSVSPALKLWDDYLYHEVRKDTMLALESVSRLFDMDPSNLLVKQEWAAASLHAGKADAVYPQISATDSVLSLQLLKADAFVFDGLHDRAKSLLSDLKPRLEESSARNYRYSYELREDSLQWNQHVERRYLNRLPEISLFLRLNPPNQMLSIAKAIELQQYDQLIPYTYGLLNTPFNADWFDIYEGLMEQLIYMGEFELAEELSYRISQLDLRARYQQRLNEVQEWKVFLEVSDFAR